MLPSDFRQCFPFFRQSADSIYLDSAATTHKPDCVLHCMQAFYERQNANVHRSSHSLGLAATSSFEQARTQAKTFINAADEKEIIWTKGVTEGINLLATILGKAHFKAGDEIVLSNLEHHANIVVWQELAQSMQLSLKIMPINEQGILDLAGSLSLITSKTALVTVGHVSNALGNINPIEAIITKAKALGALTLIDGAQASAHIPIDVQALDCDFYVFAAHKMYGPLGVGAIYGKRALLERLPPYHFGGEMIEKVSFSGTTYQGLPSKFEAGTPNIAGVLGFAEAMNFVIKNQKHITEHEEKLFVHLLKQLSKIPHITLWGDSQNTICIQSFTVSGVNNQDLGILLDQQGIAVRVGHHCAMPLMTRLGLAGTVRVSLAPYNSIEDVDQFISALNHVIKQLETSDVCVSVSDLSARTQLEKQTSQQTRNSPLSMLAGKIKAAKTWDERYRQLMLAGKQGPTLPVDQQISENEIHACESQVWLKLDWPNGCLQLQTYSPSKIVRGLLALMCEAIEGKSHAFVIAFNMQNYLALIGLDKHLSESRGNGLQQIVQHIQDSAQKYMRNIKNLP